MSIKPLTITAIDEDVDCSRVLRAFPYTGPISIVRVLDDLLGPRIDEYDECGRNWSVIKEDKQTLHAYTHIPPCGHAHDCCGCVCRYDHDITIHKDLIIVTTTTGRNF